MLTLDFIYTMKEADQKEALKLLALAIKEKKINYNPEHANPLTEYCYISSGSVEGIYFPNTEFINDSSYKMVCVAKYKGELGIVFEYVGRYANPENKNNLDFEPFDYIIYNYDERKIIESLNAEIKAYNEDLQAINLLELQTKKDGTEFADFAKNFNIENDKKTIKLCRDQLEYITIYAHDKIKKAWYTYKTLYNGYCVSEFLKDMQKHKNYCIEIIAKHTKSIKNIHNIYKDIEKIKHVLSKYSYTVKQAIKEAIR